MDLVWSVGLLKNQWRFTGNHGAHRGWWSEGCAYDPLLRVVELLVTNEIQGQDRKSNSRKKIMRTRNMKTFSRFSLVFLQSSAPKSSLFPPLWSCYWRHLEETEKIHATTCHSAKSSLQLLPCLPHLAAASASSALMAASTMQRNTAPRDLDGRALAASSAPQVAPPSRRHERCISQHRTFDWWRGRKWFKHIQVFQQRTRWSLVMLPKKHPNNKQRTNSAQHGNEPGTFCTVVKVKWNSIHGLKIWM